MVDIIPLHSSIEIDPLVSVVVIPAHVVHTVEPIFD